MNSSVSTIEYEKLLKFSSSNNGQFFTNPLNINNATQPSENVYFVENCVNIMIDNLGNKFIDKLDYQIDKNNSLGAINSDDLLVHITEVNETEENENKISIYSL